MTKIVLLCITSLFLLVACSTSHLSTMYTQPVGSNSVENSMAVVLVGNAGPETINYLQFTHSLMPAINARDINLPPNGVIAIPVPIGTKGLSLAVYTATGQPGGYLPSGTSYGYVPVRTPKVDINSRGLYFIATVLPGRRENFDPNPNPSALARLRSAEPQLADLTPVNFTWPK
jgi:hypothetical protein